MKTSEIAESPRNTANISDSPSPNLIPAGQVSSPSGAGRFSWAMRASGSAPSGARKTPALRCRRLLMRCQVFLGLGRGLVAGVGVAGLAESVWGLAGVLGLCVSLADAVSAKSAIAAESGTESWPGWGCAGEVFTPVV